MASLVGKALDQILEIVVERGAGGVLPPQDALALQCGVSRTVLREAVSKLEYLGVISSRPKIGTVINDPIKWKVVNTDVIEWRLKAGESKEQVRSEIAGVEI